MKVVASCVVGFALGWAVRAVVDSGREALVSLTAAAHGMAEAARRHAGFEREYFEDLLAEGKARWESRSKRRARSAPGAAATRSAAPGPSAAVAEKEHP